jgi:hypothetical protein
MTELITESSQFIPMYTNQSLAQLMQEFRKLSVILDDHELEARKLSILKIIKTRIDEKLDAPIQPIAIEAAPTSYQYLLRQIAYRFCMIFGFFEKASGSFLFGSNLFALIPGIHPYSLYTLTTLYILLDAFLFYAFDVSFLREYLGISVTNDSATLLNETYAQQLELINDINIALNQRQTIDWDQNEYQSYCNAMRVFNTHLLKKLDTMGEYTNTPLNRGIEKGLIVFGALSSIADSYFLAKTALLTLHISFMSSPLGWILVVSMILTTLLFYRAKEVQSMSELINSDRKSYQSLSEGLTLFATKYGHQEPYKLRGTYQQAPDSVALTLQEQAALSV